MLNFQDLPDELVLKILSYLSSFKITKDLISCGKVSKRIRNISRDGTLWVCLYRNCNKEVTHAVGKNMLERLKKRLLRKLNIDWQKINKASRKSKFPVCNKHNNIIEYFTKCGLCKQQLTRMCCLYVNKVEVQALNELLRADSIPAGLAANMFVCKLCKTFCGIKQKAAMEPDYFKNNQNYKMFVEDHKRRLYAYLGFDSSVQGDLLTSPDSTNGGPGARTQHI